MNIPLVRLGTILRVALRHGLDEFALQASYGGTSTAGVGTGAGGIGRKLLGALSGLLPAQRLQAPRGQRLRLALEELGPIFVKFGQVLSTRRDLLPTDIADELARFTALNETYKKRFGFPFIMAVKGATKEQILAGFERRLAHEPETEFNEALAQIEKIALLRLSDRLPS